MIMTSSYNIEGYEIVEYLGHISSQTVLGTGFLSTLNASFADFLGDNSSLYENKLNAAEQNAKSKLQRKALRLGGNAIIGIDVDFTTFTNDLIGVIVGGTAVVIKRIEQIQEKELYTLSSTLYTLDMPFKCTNCHILYMRNEKASYLKVSGTVYGDRKLTGICLAIKVRTMFGDIIELEETMFSDIDIQSKGEFSSEYMEINLEQKILKIAQSVECYIKKYILDGEVFNAENVEYAELVLDSNLRDIKVRHGADAVRNYKKTDTMWSCVCGKDNLLERTKCELCGREPKLNLMFDARDGINEEAFILQEHYAQLQECKNSMHIRQYLLTLPYNDEFFKNVVLEKVEEAIRLERYHGNTKEMLIKQLEKLF